WRSGDGRSPHGHGEGRARSSHPEREPPTRYTLPRDGAGVPIERVSFARIVHFFSLAGGTLGEPPPGAFPPRARAARSMRRNAASTWCASHAPCPFFVNTPSKPRAFGLACTC